LLEAKNQLPQDQCKNVKSKISKFVLGEAGNAEVCIGSFLMLCKIAVVTCTDLKQKMIIVEKYSLSHVWRSFSNGCLSSQIENHTCLENEILDKAETYLL